MKGRICSQCGKKLRKGISASLWLIPWVISQTLLFHPWCYGKLVKEGLIKEVEEMERYWEELGYKRLIDEIKEALEERGKE